MAALLGWLVACSPACSVNDPPGSPDAGSDTRDAGPPPADSGPPPPAWPHDLPPSEELRGARGKLVARTIVHLHSPLSHDACDGHGFEAGELRDAACLAHLKDALCRLHVDVANLTDHSEHLGEVSFERAFLLGQVDELVRDSERGSVTGVLRCPSGHRVAVTVGNEDALMSVGLARHVSTETDPVALAAAYDADGPDAVAAFRAAGALVFVPHTESRALDYLRSVDVDGLEIYNTHANVAPNIRTEWLGLDAADFFPALLAFTDRRQHLEPDFSLLSYLSENTNDLSKWDTLLAEGLHRTGIAGNDAHENTFGTLMSDGERGDSYRRLLRWFSNHVLVDERDVANVRDALARGRSYVAFEAFGSPVGFDFVGTLGERTFDMGDTAPRGVTLHIERPTMHPSVPLEGGAPAVRLRLVRAAAGGGVEVSATDDAELEVTPDQPGAYRVEVRITPHHARPYLGRLADSLVHEYVWIYSNAIFVE